MDSKALFEKTPPGKLFFMTAVPGSVGMLVSAIYQFFEGIFVGRFLGDTAFAALNLAMPFVIINFALADLIGVGSAVPISISLGRKDNKTANNYFTCACIMVVLTGAVIGAFLYAAAPALMSLMGAEGAFASMAAEYLRVYAICSPITTIVFAMDNYLRICGKIRMSMYLNIFMAAFTVIIGYLFLGVFGWGIWSMALATCTGMIMTVTLSIMPFFTQKAVAAFCKARIQLQSDKEDCFVRRSELSQQYCGQNNINNYQPYSCIS